MTNQSLSSTFKRNIFLTKIIAINAPLKYTIAVVSKIPVPQKQACLLVGNGNFAISRNGILRLGKL